MVNPKLPYIPNCRLGMVPFVIKDIIRDKTFVREWFYMKPTGFDKGPYDILYCYIKGVVGYNRIKED